MPLPFFLFLSLFFQSLAALAVTCEITARSQSETISIPGLSAKQNQYIHKIFTEAQELEVQIFKSFKSGVEKTVVVIGENHNGIPADNAMGKNLVNTFAHVGTEMGASSHGQEQMKFVVLPVAQFLMAPEMMLRSFRKNREYETSGESTMSYPRQNPNITVFNVEKGRAYANLTENLALLTLAGESATYMACGAACLFAGVSSAVQGDLPSAALSLKIGAYVLYSRFARGPLLNPLVETALLKNRDQAMAQNINQFFEKNPNTDQLLVVVGRRHLQGMAEHLKRRYRFNQVELQNENHP